MRRFLTNEILISIAKITFGNLLLGFAYAQWMRPNGIINGGVTSLAMIFERISTLSVIFFANGITVILLLLCLIFLGKERFLKSVYSGICYNIFFAIFTLIPFSLNIHIAIDFILACFFISYGYHTCLKARSSAVSMDIIALIIHKTIPMQPFAKILRYINLTVLLAGLLVYGIWAIALGVLFTIINTQILKILHEKALETDLANAK